MEQYWMPKKLDFKNLKFCLDNYTAENIFIRLVGSRGGIVKVDENLEGKKLKFKKDKFGLDFLIDSKKVFHFNLERYDGEFTKGFSVAYERFEKIGDSERKIILATGENPYDENFPEPRHSILRNVLDDHLLEICFKGRINLKFHSWWEKPHWKYWEAVK